ncbi:MAG: trk/ktr system potassium uptake protein [Clostridia bacterium]|nr:trk/ktr system potassium uptake protein [Clostridia bacterium]
MKQFAVIGLGRFGISVARTLSRMGHEVIAIDSDEQKVENIMDEVTTAIQADARDEQTLKSIGIQNADVVIVAIGENVEANILVTLMVKEMGVKTVVAKAINSLHGKVLAKIGADKIVFPERDMGARVAYTLTSGNVIDHIELSPDYSILELVAPKRVVGKTLGEINLRAKHGVNVMAIKRNGEIIAAPGADDVVREGDILVLIGSNRDLKGLQDS